MTTKLKILLFFLIGVNTVFGFKTKKNQQNSPADCHNAIEIQHFKESKIQFLGNSGKNDDLNEFFPDLNEVNSVWLKLEPRLKGNFEVSLFAEENFDFQYYVFRDTSSNFCDSDYSEFLVHSDSLVDIKNNLPKPLLYNVKTDFNDVFYVLLHSKDIHKKTVVVNFELKGERVSEAIKVQNFKKSYLKNAVRISIRDSLTGEPVLANMTIDRLGVDGKLFQGTDFVFDATKEPQSEVFVNAKGYFYYANSFDLNTGQDVDLKMSLIPLSPGIKLPLEGLKFQADSKDFLPASYVVLRRLLEFMILNSDVKIEIRGHINAPGKKMNRKIKKLSKKRAKNTYLYLIRNGISRDRVEYKGMGNLEMLFPQPKNISEEEANRRVEIVIL